MHSIPLAPNNSTQAEYTIYLIKDTLKNLAITLNKLGAYWGFFSIIFLIAPIAPVVLGCRKQYIWLSLYLFTPILLYFLSFIINQNLSYVFLGLNFHFVCFFKKTYIQYSIKNILAIKRKYQNEQLMIEAIKQKNGISWFGALIGIIVMLLDFVFIGAIGFIPNL